MTCTIDPAGLIRTLETSTGTVLLDVMLPEHYQAHHIPGALNVCVYEVVFMETVRRLIPNPDTPIIVYDTSSRSQASECAVQKLTAGGYRNVCELSGGLEAWLAAGRPLEPAGAALQGDPGIQEGSYRIDPEKSQVVWTGRNLNGRHTGTLAISSGEITIAQGQLTGRIALDMKSLTNSDLQQADYRDMLINHLLSEDFFEVEKYPQAEALLKSWSPIPGATPGRANYLIEADLTIKGVTHPVQLPALIAPDADGIKAQATLEIDRTQWNVRYGSGRLFEKLGMHLVNDMVTLDFFLLAV
ncbi:sulfurtransferase [Geomonas silvestris]|uniref:Sulfurtransferase n=1 Tax=Geomonas silvestris TaxID=2740184 RepID=A0A6V8MEL9_9BACT|nr:YceI family protein [Geomonas silvestris]GFO58448.1 sulfurtransferase [Geomonas silvestris]